MHAYFRLRLNGASPIFSSQGRRAKDFKKHPFTKRTQTIFQLKMGAKRRGNPAMRCSAPKAEGRLLFIYQAASALTYRNSIVSRN